MNKIELLEWQKEMGADEALENEPVNRLMPAAPAFIPEKPKNISGFAENPAPDLIKPSELSGSPRKAESSARNIAEKCTTLEELKKAITDFDGLAIKKTATNTVFSDGDPQAEIMFIGEAPGENEDLQGIPFCGASGKLMDEILKWAGFERSKNIYISNTLFWRPPGNRRPTPEELAICRPFVERHIALINPKLLVLVGGTATLALLSTKTGITKLRGKFHEYKNPYLSDSIPTVAVFHPSFLLRQPSQKKTFWFDILAIKDFCKKNNIII